MKNTKTFYNYHVSLSPHGPENLLRVKYDPALEVQISQVALFLLHAMPKMATLEKVLQHKINSGKNEVSMSATDPKTRTMREKFGIKLQMK